MKGRKAVSLTYEIDHVADALEGGCILARAFAEQQLSNDYDHRRVPASLLAILVTTVERLRLIAAVLRREVPAVRLWNQANDTTPRPVHDEDYDVRLVCDPEPLLVPPPGRAPGAGPPARERRPTRERRSNSDRG